MNKIVLAASFIGISLLFTLGLLDPTNPAVWLASTSIQFAVVRFILLMAFGLMLITTPPRTPFVRKTLAMLVTVVAAFAISATYQNQMKILDTITLLEFSVSAGIVVLERGGQELLAAALPGKSTKRSKQLAA